MSDLFARAMMKGDPFAEAKKAVGHLKERFPMIHDVLAGYTASNGVVDRMPGSIRLFTNGGALKVEVTGQDWLMKGYLVIPQGLLTFEAIEAELAAGNIGWTAKHEQPNSKTKPPY